MEATMFLGFIGACIGGAIAGLWYAIDLLLGTHTMGNDQLKACVILGAILTPALIGAVFLIGDMVD